VPAISAVLAELALRQRHAAVLALFRASLDLLFTLGMYDDRIAAARLAFASAEATDDHRTASLACEVLTSTFALRGELDHAREALAHGLLAAERSSDPREVARQRGSAGVFAYRSRDPRRALVETAGADALAREADDPETAVNVLGVRSAAHWYLGETDEAERAAGASLEVCEAMGWRRAVAHPLRVLADVAVIRGDHALAVERLERAREIAATHDDRRQLTRVTLSAARLALAERRVADAVVGASAAVSDAQALGLAAEAEEAAALLQAARRARVLPTARRRYAQRLPHRFSEAPVGGI
jgi:hypothetical protein